MAKSLKVPLMSEKYSEVELKSSETVPLQRPEPRLICNTIKCSVCSTDNMYPDGSFVIKCSKCLQVIAVKKLSCLTCVRCRVQFFFPEGSPLVSCTCGLVYSTGHIPYQNFK